MGCLTNELSHIRAFRMLATLPLRPPAMFAKAAATLDLLSGGRFEARLGAGGFLDAAQATGASARTPGQSLESLEEAIVILLAWWGTTGVLRLHGHHYALEGARPGPRPAHPIGIWHGGAKPRALALTERKADGWAAPLMNYLPPIAAIGAQTVIDDAALPARRDPREIRRIYNVPGAFTTTAAARAQAEPVAATAAETSQ
jgi:alkanesulfonate monooxygenase SsuD/methylene tetrahydromethanopterin reductase-like flavin-dependent oxidoreductase (luciferase family)